MWAGSVGYAVWFSLQIKTWWILYLFGADDRWKGTYDLVFAYSTKVLPSFGNHLAPEAMHLTIQLLLLVILAAAVVGLVQRQREKVSSAHLK